MTDATMGSAVKQRLSGIPTERISPLRIVGFTLYCAWILAVFYSTFLYAASSDFREALYLNMFVSMAALALCLLIVPKAVKRADKWVLSKRVIYPAAGCMAVATAVLCFADSASTVGYVIIVASGVLTGASSGILLLGWLRLFADAGTRTTLIEVASSWTLAALICLVLFFLPGLASTVITIAIAIVSGIILRQAAMGRPDRPMPARAHRLHPRTRRMFGRGLFAAVNFGIVAGFSDVLSGFRYLPIPDSYGVYLLAGVVVTAAIVLTVGLLAKHDAIAYSYRITFLFIAMGCMTIPFIQTTQSVSNIIIFGGYTCFTIVLTVVCVDISNYFDVPATKAMGYAFAALYGGEVLGAAAAQFVTAIAPNQDMLTTISFFLTGAVLFANLFLFTEKDLTETSIGEMVDTDAQREAAAPQAEDRVAAVSAQLVDKFRLTPREAEVLPLIIKGRTIARMQEELFISQGTVSTHTRHIYQKIGVRNRQALLDLVDQMDEE